jgi:aldose 1-epimerase
VIIVQHIVHLSAWGYQAEILPERGANLISLTRPELGLRSVRTPCSLEDFSVNPFLWGVPILLPPNRISGGQFSFEGRNYHFPINEPELGNFLHGELHETTFSCIQHNHDHAIFLFRALPEAPYMTFPHAFTILVAFSLEIDGMHQCISITNNSELNMPFAIGCHTTFALPFKEGGKAEDVRLFLGVSDEIVRDMDSYLPTGQVITDSSMQQEMLRGTFYPCKHTLSRHFVMDSNREMRLIDPIYNVQLVYRALPPYAYWMVYNGGSSDFLCVEPQTWMNNCPNAPFDREKTGFSWLAPGETRNCETIISLIALD